MPPLKRCTKRLAPMALSPRAACLTSRNTTSVMWKRAPDIVQLPDDSPSDMVAGRCVGMVGGILMLEQGGNVFAAPVKEWESYEVEITVGELLCEYEYEPQQMGLF